MLIKEGALYLDEIKHETLQLRYLENHFSSFKSKIFFIILVKMCINFAKKKLKIVVYHFLFCFFPTF